MNLRFHWNTSSVIKPALNKHVLSGNTRRGQRGIVLPLAVISLLPLLGFTALAIDVGHLFVVRNELQNAADAAALAGASHLAPYTGSPLTPNWTTANSGATNSISLNKAVNTTLVNGVVTTGYWDITGSTPGVHPTSTPPNDLPAVMVTITKASGSNGGAVNAFFAQVLPNIAPLNVAATAVAVVSSPSNTSESLLPIAIPECLYSSEYWDSTTNEPVTPSTTFSLGSTIFYSGCGSTIEAEWTSLDTGAQSTTEIRNLIDQATGNATDYDQSSLAIDDSIHIESGVHSTLYDTPHQTSINGCSDSYDGVGDDSCAYGLIPVVQDICTNCDTPIIGFACAHILSATGAPSATINIQLVAMDSVPQCKMSGSGVGPSFGAYQPPRLANYWGNTF